jgi:DNA-binding response OmpR family regulator
MTTYEFPELTVLIGEDYALIREFLGQIFDILNVKRIDIVEDGDKVVCKAKEFSYDLILLDLNMPAKDGFEVMLERNSFQGHPTIVALTANTQFNIKEKCLRAGMDDFLIKPVMWDELIVILMKHFKNKALLKG